MWAVSNFFSIPIASFQSLLTLTTLGEKRDFDRFSWLQPLSPKCFRDLHCQVLRKNAFYSKKHNLHKPILQTSTLQSLTRLSLAEHRKEGEINGTLNPFKPGRETWGSGLFSSGDAADPDESKDLRRPSALEMHIDRNVNDSFWSVPMKSVWVCSI